MTLKPVAAAGANRQACAASSDDAAHALGSSAIRACLPGARLIARLIAGLFGRIVRPLRLAVGVVAVSALLIVVRMS
jgi:hypothetical protein